MKYYTDPNDYLSGNDAVSIQTAVDEASKQNLNQVVIPRINNRTGKALWTIDRAVLLPDNMTVILDGCCIRMADGSFDNIFRNSLALSPEGNTINGKQTGIRILGKNGAILDGGLPNGLNEDTSRKDGMPHISKNLFIYFHNVEDFEVSGFTCKDQRWWAMAYMFCRNGRITKLNFKLTRHLEDRKIRWRNQDGIDLRIGCSNILIEDIEGETGDDFIALTALRGFETDNSDYVQNASTDIHDVIINNVRGITSMCAIIRLLCQRGNQIYNISMNNIFDISRPGIEAQSQMCFRLGDDAAPYYGNNPDLRCKPGDMHDITIKNVYTRARTGINLVGCIKNLHADSIHMIKDGGAALFCGQAGVSNVFIYHPTRQKEYEAIKAPVPAESGFRTQLENITIENITYSTEGKYSPAVLCAFDTDMKNVTVKNVANDTSLPLTWYSDSVSDRFNIN